MILLIPRVSNYYTENKEFVHRKLDLRTVMLLRGTSFSGNQLVGQERSRKHFAELSSVDGIFVLFHLRRNLTTSYAS